MMILGLIGNLAAFCVAIASPHWISLSSEKESFSGRHEDPARGSSALPSHSDQYPAPGAVVTRAAVLATSVGPIPEQENKRNAPTIADTANHRKGFVLPESWRYTESLTFHLPPHPDATTAHNSSVVARDIEHAFYKVSSSVHGLEFRSATNTLTPIRRVMREGIEKDDNDRDKEGDDELVPTYIVPSAAEEDYFVRFEDDGGVTITVVVRDHDHVVINVPLPESVKQIICGIDLGGENPTNSSVVPDQLTTSPSIVASSTEVVKASHSKPSASASMRATSSVSHATCSASDDLDSQTCHTGPAPTKTPCRRTVTVTTTIGNALSTTPADDSKEISEESITSSLHRAQTTSRVYRTKGATASRSGLHPSTTTPTSASSLKGTPVPTPHYSSISDNDKTNSLNLIFTVTRPPHTTSSAESSPEMPDPENETFQTFPFGPDPFDPENQLDPNPQESPFNIHFRRDHALTEGGNGDIAPLLSVLEPARSTSDTMSTTARSSPASSTATTTTATIAQETLSFIREKDMPQWESHAMSSRRGKWIFWDFKRMGGPQWALISIMLVFLIWDIFIYVPHGAFRVGWWWRRGFWPFVGVARWRQIPGW